MVRASVRCWKGQRISCKIVCSTEVLGNRCHKKRLGFIKPAGSSLRRNGASRDLPAF